MAATDYCTLAEVEAYAGVDFSEGIGPTDSQIATMITTASRLLGLRAIQNTLIRHSVWLLSP